VLRGTLLSVAVAGCYAPSPPAGSPCPDGLCRRGPVCSPATQTCERERGELDIDAAIDTPIASFSYRVPITFDAPADTTNAIVLVVLDGTFQYTHASPDASDVRLGDSTAGDTPYWIEGWDPDGNSYVWARVPTVTSGANTIHLYYGSRTGPLTSESNFDVVFPNTQRSTADTALGGVLAQDAFILEMPHTGTVTAGAPLEIVAPYVRISGTINADGAGYPSGMGPGMGGTSTTAGAGGGGHGGVGGAGGGEATDMFGVGGVVNGTTQGEMVDMGSSGGISGALLGGAGGGAVRIKARRIVLDGTIQARGAIGTGGTRSSGGGAGGGVLLQGTSIAFTGTISVNGGAGANGPAAGNDGAGGGGGGRIKLYSRGDVTATGMRTFAGGTGGTGGDAQPGQAGATGTSATGTSTVADPLPTVGVEESL